jgi:peptidoglycan/LPS O-acetylase OafA/YrhL
MHLPGLQEHSGDGQTVTDVTTPRPASTYRPDIDGLRALAVLPVLFFHAGFAFAPGGFVGVDVFFVISGYLITLLIHGEMTSGRFSLLHFYERRVRRLFPALCAVLAVCAAVSAWLLLPQDLRYFGGSLTATTAFLSNVFFWLEAGYFDVAAERKPLLHTWSLAVEEQFYLLFPLFLLLVLRYLPRRVVTVTAAVTLLSLLGSEWALRNTDSAAFYLAPFRAWELGLGALLALGAVPAARSRKVATAAAWLGLAAIGTAVVAFSWQTPFPGLSALLPCLGTALVIWAGSGPPVVASRLLGGRPLVFIGLISYSLYLWHWPLLVFARHYAVRDLTVGESSMVLAAATVLAAASWRYIERPFRGSHALLTRRQLFAAAGSLLALLGLAGLALVASSGWPQRLDATTLQLLAGADDRNPSLDSDDLRAGKACRLGAPGDPTIIVWGDSHADTLLEAFDGLGTASGQAVLFLGKIGCAPLLDVDRIDLPFDCRAYNDAARALIEASGAEQVVLMARWTHYTRTPTYGREERTRVVIADDQSTRASVRGNDAVLARGLERTLEFLAARRVFVVATVPEVGRPVPQALAQAHRLGRDLDIRPTLVEYRERQRTVAELLADAARRHEFVLLEPASLLCRSGHCQVEQDGRPLYFDDNHLSNRGGAALAPMLAPAFGRAPTEAGGPRLE